MKNLFEVLNEIGVEVTDKGMYIQINIMSYKGVQKGNANWSEVMEVVPEGGAEESYSIELYVNGEATAEAKSIPLHKVESVIRYRIGENFKI